MDKTSSTPPVQPPTQNQKSAPAPPVDAAPAPRVIARVPIEEAPPQMIAPRAPVKTEAEVKSVNAKEGTVTLQTKDGPVTIKTAVPLPPETKVMLEVFQEKAQTLANVTVLRQQATATKEIQQIVQPALKEGKVATAVLIPAEDIAAAKTTPQTPLEELAKAIEQIKQIGVQKLPAAPPLPQDVIQKILTSQNLPQTLKSLPPPMQEAVRNFVMSPGVQDFIQKFLTPQISSALPAAAGNANAGNANPDIDFQAAPTRQPDILQKLLSAYVPSLSRNLSTALPDLKNDSTAEDILLRIPAPQTSPAAGTTAKESTGFWQALLSLTGQPEPLSPALPPLAKLLPIPQNLFQIKILRLLPPDMPEKQLEEMAKNMGSSAPDARGNLRTGTVEAVTPSGFPVIRAGEEHFVLNTTDRVTPGTKVIFESIPVTTPDQIAAPLSTATAAPSAATSAFDPLRSPTWPALEEALDVLAGVAPQAAQTAKAALPAPSPKLASTALFFLAAMRIGDVESWLGEKNLQSLRQNGKNGLVDRLKSDFGKLSGQSREVLSGDWRAISMPILHDDRLSQIQFFVRQQHGDAQDDNDKDGKPATRFLLNLHLSRMGDMQLDGYIQKKKFDLVLRTQDRLTAEMRNDIMQRFAQGLEQVNMQGGVSFQTRQQSWVSVDLPQQGMMA